MQPRRFPGAAASRAPRRGFSYSPEVEGAPLKLTTDNLRRQLAERLLPVYLVSGDEPLLAGEALDAIRTHAAALGYVEREQVHIDRTASVWEHALSVTQTRSLFASRRILEIRMANGKPGFGAATLLKLIAAAGDEL